MSIPCQGLYEDVRNSPISSSLCCASAGDGGLEGKMTLFEERLILKNLFLKRWIYFKIDREWKKGFTQSWGRHDLIICPSILAWCKRGEKGLAKRRQARFLCKILQALPPSWYKTMASYSGWPMWETFKTQYWRDQKITPDDRDIKAKMCWVLVCKGNMDWLQTRSPIWTGKALKDSEVFVFFMCWLLFWIHFHGGPFKTRGALCAYHE